MYDEASVMVLHWLAGVTTEQVREGFVRHEK